MSDTTTPDVFYLVTDETEGQCYVFESEAEAFEFTQTGDVDALAVLNMNSPSFHALLGQS